MLLFVMVYAVCLKPQIVFVSLALKGKLKDQFKFCIFCWHRSLHKRNKPQKNQQKLNQ